MHEDTLCPGCGHQRDRAWHPDMDGWYEPKHYKCAACSAIQDHAVHYSSAVDDRDPSEPLPDIPLEVIPDRPSA